MCFPANVEKHKNIYFAEHLQTVSSVIMKASNKWLDIFIKNIWYFKFEINNHVLLLK